ncbi:unnamed protein product [Soboliphyme baturini]|uniref:Serum response factor-binding protein 1 n=1 Tax=Soboliphyme baturini TaxID=241478 RepID=A0A183IQS8_9BILA|nr:unnamed protein product [Soboliphyme baturini]
MSEVTALDLNNQIVKMRKVVGQAKFRLSSKTIRRIKFLKKKCEHSDKSASLTRKIQRYVEELPVIRQMKPDEVSKFALVNTKLLNELKMQKETPASDRVLYKLATSRLMVETVDEYRAKHSNWHQEIPFLLQRLGLQYHRRKKTANAHVRVSDKGDDDEHQPQSEVGVSPASVEPSSAVPPNVQTESNVSPSTNPHENLLGSSALKPSNSCEPHLNFKDEDAMHGDKEMTEKNPKSSQKRVMEVSDGDEVPTTDASGTPSLLERLKVQRKKEKSFSRKKRKQQTKLGNVLVGALAPKVPVEGRVGEMEVRMIHLEPAREATAPLLPDNICREDAIEQSASAAASSEDEDDPFFSANVSSVSQNSYVMSNVREERFDKKDSPLERREKKEMRYARRFTPRRPLANAMRYKLNWTQ